MRLSLKLAMTAALVLAGTGPSFAFWNCPVPEIDGPAGISALAFLVSAGMLAYNRTRA